VTSRIRGNATTDARQAVAMLIARQPDFPDSATLAERRVVTEAAEAIVARLAAPVGDATFSECLERTRLRANDGENEIILAFLLVERARRRTAREAEASGTAANLTTLLAEQAWRHIVREAESDHARATD